MVVIVNTGTVEDVANGVAPTTGANGGPFASVVTTNGTVLASTAQARSGTNSIKFECTGTGSSFNAVCAASTIPSNYETIYCSFSIYIDTMGSTSTVCSLVFLSARYCVYLFNSTGWKIGITPVHNSTSVKTGSEATSAAMSTGAWHDVTAIYRKISATDVEVILEVDGVRTTSGAQTPANFTIVGTSGTYRIGPASQIGFEANSTLGDIFYLDNLTISAFPASAPTNPGIIRNGMGRRKILGVGPLYVG